MASSPPPPPTLPRLLFKYEEIVELRRLATLGGPAPRERLRALARELPGSLRTLDALAPDVLARRLHELRAAVAGDAPAQPWMHVELAYHAAIRRLLAERRVVPSAARERAGEGLVASAIAAVADEVALPRDAVRAMVVGTAAPTRRPQPDDEPPPLSPEVAAGVAVGALDDEDEEAEDDDDESLDAPPEGFGDDE